MARIKHYKVAQLPEVLEPDVFYWVLSDDNSVRGYLTDRDGNARRINEDDKLVIRKTAGEAIGALKGVKIDALGKAWIARNTDADVDGAIGLSAHAANVGSSIDIQISGEMIDGAWDFEPGSVWLNEDGQATQDVPTNGSLFRLGVATGPVSLIVNPTFIAALGA